MFIFQVEATNLGVEGKRGLPDKAIENPETVLLETLTVTSHPHPTQKGDVNFDGKIDNEDLGILDEALTYGDMNNDGKLDQEDYKTLMSQVGSRDSEAEQWVIEKGDINQDGKIDKKDLNLLGNVLQVGDLDSDGKVDRTDYNALNDIINPVKKGDTNSDGNVDKQDVKLLEDALSFGDMNQDGKLDQEDYKILADQLPHVLFRASEDKESDQQCIQHGDINRDGNIDETDLNLLGNVLRAGDMDSNNKVDQTDLKILNDQVNPPPFEFPKDFWTWIDLDNDKKIDYVIENGHIYKNTGEEVDHIDGVDLKELAEEIKKNIEDPNEVPSPSFDFIFDINHDGKEDKINSPELLALDRK